MMTSVLPAVQITPSSKLHAPLALGCWTFGPNQWTGEEDVNLLSAMETSLECGITHFDTAAGYGDGYSEQLIGRFMRGRRDQIFLATKGDSDDMSAAAMLSLVRQSLDRLQTEQIDLFYIHWPRTGKDLRPWMEGLETARQRGWIAAIGVSNFSVEQMAQVQQVGTINAHQLYYHVLWRREEDELIPYCREYQIAVVAYSSLAHGILSGKFPRELHIGAGDDRAGILLFRSDVWQYIYPAVEQLKVLAAEAGRSLSHLAIRWLLQQGVTSALAGARDSIQARQNAEALSDDISADVFQRMTAISDQVAAQLPNVGNIYQYYP